MRGLANCSTNGFSWGGGPPNLWKGFCNGGMLLRGENPKERPQRVFWRRSLLCRHSGLRKLIALLGGGLEKQVQHIRV